MVNVQIDTVDKHIDKATYLYYGILSMIHVAYIIAFLGIATIDSSYIHLLNVSIQVFIVVFLLYRFNPLRKNIKLTEADTTIVFGSAILLATNLIGVEVSRRVSPLLKDIKNWSNG